jgi:CRP-like cAMP-binding protein
MTDVTMADEAEDREEGGGELSAAAKEPKSSRPWLTLISDAERIFETYQAKADSIDKLYADLEKLSNIARDRQFQLFWANIAVLGPSIYSRPPVPVVVPRFKDRKPLPRLASELLERSAIVSFELEDIDSVMRLIRDDITVVARGAAWLRYEASGKGRDFKEKVCIDHMDRKDFVHDPARKWKDVDWVAYRAWMTKSEMRKRFKKTSGNAYMDCTFSKRKDDKDADDGKLKAGVWELWSKSQNRVIWVSEGCEKLLDDGAPHLTLDGFFPCPRPAYGTIQRRTLIPVPDMLFYKDQLEEINELTGRIAALAESLKVRGFYPAGAGDIGDAIEAAVKSTSDNQVLVPVSNWSMVGQGGVKDMIVWLPLEMIANTITQLVNLRKQLFDDVYQITGLSDIMRGQTEASETLGAQQLKSQYGSVRIRDRQDEMIRMARDITRIGAEIMSENFAAKTLLDMSQLEIPTDADMAAKAAPLVTQLKQIETDLRRAQSDPEVQQLAQANPDQAKQIMGQAQQQVQQLQGQIAQLKQAPTIEKVMDLLHEQRLRPFVLDIETDSTIAPDENAQKQRATEFVTAVGGVMKQATEILATTPQAAPVIAEVLKFTASQFRAGRQMEGVIDEFADKMAEIAAQPKPPDPKQAEAAAQQQAEQLRQKQEAETTAATNAERLAGAQKTAAEANAKNLEAQTAAADAVSQRKIKEQQEIDASEARRIEREGKAALTDKQIQLLDAKRQDEMLKHSQDLELGNLQIETARVNLEKAKLPPPAPKPPAGANAGAS